MQGKQEIPYIITTNSDPMIQPVIIISKNNNQQAYISPANGNPDHNQQGGLSEKLAHLSFSMHQNKKSHIKNNKTI